MRDERASAQFRIPFKVANRFGEDLDHAILRYRVREPYLSKTDTLTSSHEDGTGILSFDRPESGGSLTADFDIRWEDRDGVSWGFTGSLEVAVPPAVDSEGSSLTPRGFSITSRTFPQGLPIAEVSRSTRKALLLQPNQELHRAFEEARDSFICGLPNASTVLSGKALETAILVKGAELGWPIARWKASKLTLGRYLSENIVRDEVGRNLGMGFYGALLGTNIPRINAAHQKGGHLHMDEARAVIRSLTQLLDDWFGGVPPATHRSRMNQPSRSSRRIDAKNSASRAPRETRGNRLVHKAPAKPSSRQVSLDAIGAGLIGGQDEASDSTIRAGEVEISFVCESCQAELTARHTPKSGRHERWDRWCEECGASYVVGHVEGRNGWRWKVLPGQGVTADDPIPITVHPEPENEDESDED